MAWLLVVAFWALPATAQSTCPPGALTVPEKARLVVEGDSLVYGLDAGTTGGQPAINASDALRSKAPFPERLAQDLGDRLTVENHGFPGDRSIDGLKRWASAPTPALTLIMYGTNDFGNFGQNPEGPLTTAAFGENLRQLAQRRIDQGGQVLLLTPPPMNDVVADARLQPYRAATHEIAAQLKLPVVDTPSVLSLVASKWIDGLHLSVEANTALAEALAARVCIGE